MNMEFDRKPKAAAEETTRFLPQKIEAAHVGWREIEELRMSRRDIIPLLRNPLIAEILTGTYVRVVGSND